MQKKNILLKEHLIEYTLRRSKRARFLRISVLLDGTCTLTVPYRIDETAATQFLTAQAEWVLTKLAFFKRVAAPPLPPHTPALYREYLPKAKDLICNAVDRYNIIYGASYNSICVKHQKSRWGSCSHNHNLNFNYRLAFLPCRLLDYVVVHELCHLKEFNHSSAFWKHVAITMPHYSALRAELRNQPM